VVPTQALIKDDSDNRSAEKWIEGGKHV
jgi:hypothetical protein